MQEQTVLCTDLYRDLPNSLQKWLALDVAL